MHTNDAIDYRNARFAARTALARTSKAHRAEDQLRETGSALSVLLRFIAVPVICVGLVAALILAGGMSWPVAVLFVTAVGIPAGYCFGRL